MPCQTPFYVKNNRYGIDAVQISKIPVGCGKCPYCIERRVNEWIVRLKNEMKISTSSLFVTLTYNTDYVPITQNRFMSLDKPDVQKFFKRLRKLHSKHSTTKIKYYLTGEYGTKRKRPHYHAIIFNAEKLDILRAWFHPEQNLPLGDVHFGTHVSDQAIAYTVKYMAKPTVHRKKFGRDDREPEFSLMSKGLGLNYLTPSIIAYHQSNIEHNYVTHQGGFKTALPRYFKERLYTEDQRKQQALIAQAKAKAELNEQKTKWLYENPKKTEKDWNIYNDSKYDQKLRTYFENSCKNRNKI